MATKSTNDRTYTTRDLCEHFKMNAKSLRRKMRAHDIRVGRGKRHMFTRREYERIIAQLTQNS